MNYRNSIYVNLITNRLTAESAKLPIYLVKVMMMLARLEVIRNSGIPKSIFKTTSTFKMDDRNFPTKVNKLICGILTTRGLAQLS